AGLLRTQKGPAGDQPWRPIETQVFCLRVKQLQMARKHAARRGCSWRERDDIEPEWRTSKPQRLIDQRRRRELAQQSVRQSVVGANQEHRNTVQIRRKGGKEDKEAVPMAYFSHETSQERTCLMRLTIPQNGWDDKV